MVSSAYTRPQVWIVGLALLVAGMVGPMAGAQQTTFETVKEARETAVFMRTLVPALLDQMRRLSRHDPELMRLMARIRVEIPTDVNVEWEPMAWGVASPDGDSILVDARYLDYVISAATVGAADALPTVTADSILARLARDVRVRRLRVSGARSFRAEKHNLSRYMAGAREQELALFEQFQSQLFNDGFVWLILHEAGHHALGHASPAPSLHASRQREMQADRWAFEKMQQMGYGLFWLGRFLDGQMLIERWEDKGDLVSEMRSSHPSWRTRADALAYSPNVWSAPIEDWISCFAPMPGTKGLTYFTIPRPTSRTRLGNFGRLSENYWMAGVEWEGDVAHLYSRMANGIRQESIFEDTDQFVGKVTVRTYDASGGVTTSTPVPTYQQSFPVFENIPAPGGGTFRDMMQRTKNRDIERRALRAVGASVDMTRQILETSDAQRNARESALMSFYKGQTTPAQAEAEFQAIWSAYESRLRSLFGADLTARYLDLVTNDSAAKAIQIFMSGSIPRHADALLRDWLKP